MAIFDELKSIGGVLQEAGKIEQYQQILETQRKLLEMQKEIINLEEENKKLKRELEISKDLVSEGNMYWCVGPDSKDGPFCTCCWDSDRKLIRLHAAFVSDRMTCPKCSTVAKAGKAVSFRSNLAKKL